MCGEHFCSMKSSHELRDLAKKLEEKNKEFKDKGGEIYM
jgi:hypothetical protein